MYSVRYGIDLSVETLDVESAREALLTAEQFVAAGRPHVVVTDTAAMRVVSFEELRELAESEDENVAD
jgi:fatty acid-binding protein DegV